MRAEQATELNDRTHGWKVIRKFLLPAVAVLLAAAATSAMSATHAVAGADDENQGQDHQFSHRATTIGRTVIVRQTADFPRSSASIMSGNFSSARHSR